MKHYCCIIESQSLEDEIYTRLVMVVASSDWPIKSSRDLESDPPIIGRVTSRGKRFKTAGRGYGTAFIIAMCQEIEAAMRRGGFPNPNLEIPDEFVTNLIQNDLPKATLGTHFIGEIVYSFSI
jgi:hypothetical protein